MKYKGKDYKLRELTLGTLADIADCMERYDEQMAELEVWAEKQKGYQEYKTLMNEIRGYSWEYDNAKSLKLTEARKKELEKMVDERRKRLATAHIYSAQEKYYGKKALMDLKFKADKRNQTDVCKLLVGEIELDDTIETSTFINELFTFFLLIKETIQGRQQSTPEPTPQHSKAGKKTHSKAE